jgi:peptidoglycan/LPS O-acetylase OafA/YrhL
METGMAEQGTTFGRWAVVGVWAIAIVGSAVVVALAYSGTDVWLGDPGPYGAFAALGAVLAASVLGALALQLASRRPPGFVGRASASIAGAVLVIALASLALLPVVLG